ncbi:MAG: hypothetical protein U0746_02615 [Gemmataceae bacterium]
MESIRKLVARIAATAVVSASWTVLPIARGQDGYADMQPPRTLPSSAAYQHVPLIPRDLGSYAAQNPAPPPVTPRQPSVPTATLSAPIAYRQTAWLSAPTGAQQPAPMPVGEPGPIPKKDGEAPKPPAATTPKSPPQYQTYPAMTAPSAAPSWRWHGYGAVATTDVAQPISAGMSPPPFTPSQPVYPPAAPAESKPTETAPAVTPPAGVNARNGGSDWMPPGGYTTPPPMPSLPAATPNLSPLTYLEPVWKSAGDRVAAANPMSADVWPQQYAQPQPIQQQPIVPAGYSYPQPAYSQMPSSQPSTPTSSWGSAFYPANPVVAASPSKNYTPRGVSDGPTTFAPAYPMPAIKQAAFSAPPPKPSTVTEVRAVERQVPPVNRIESRPPDLLGQFKAAIDRVCAGRGYDVELTARSSSSLLLKMKVKKATDAEVVAAKIALIPELGPYQIAYEIQVQP